MEITARRVAFPSRSVKSNNINLTTRKKQLRCFSHINGHGPPKGRSDQRSTGSGAIQTIWAV